MAWDSRRPVPWTRLTREWALYAAIMAVIFALFFRDAGLVGAIAGLIVSLPLYLGLGALLAKFGYQRKTLRQLRAESVGGADQALDPAGAASAASAPRERPRPTKRTASGPSNRSRPASRRRR